MSAALLPLVSALTALTGVVLVDRDVPYVANAQALQTLDVYSTLEGDERPVLVWVHGGGWRGGDKRALHSKVDAFVAERGFVLVSVNYRLHPVADYRDQASDVAAAIAWTLNHANEYGGSADRVVVMGHSAGAHLVALAVCDPGYFRAFGRKPSDVRQVVLLDGAGYDIAQQVGSAREQSRRLYQTVFSDDPAIHKGASPLTYVGETRLPEFVVAHVATRADSTAQSKALVEAIQNAGGEATRVAAEGKVHATINRDIGVSGDAFSDRILEAIERAFAGESARPSALPE